MYYRANYQSLYDTISSILVKSGILSQIQTFTDFAAENPECSFLTGSSTKALTHTKTRTCLINDKDSEPERIFSLFHETGHLVANTTDEKTADTIAICMCQLVEALTGQEVAADPMKGHHLTT